MYGARSESTKVLLLFFVLMALIVLAIVGCIVTAFTYADPQWTRDNWNTLEEKVYPLPLDDAISIVNTNFTTLGVTASICTILLLLNVWASWHLRKRINREGRFFEPLEPEEEMEERWKKNP
jgi:ABC-type Fe3+ transport system permease subunit